MLAAFSIFLHFGSDVSFGASVTTLRCGWGKFYGSDWSFSGAAVLILLRVCAFGGDSFEVMVFLWLILFLVLGL